jgi:hypothetical protein
MLPDCDKKRCTNLLQLSPYRYKGPETYSASKGRNISNFYFTGPNYMRLSGLEKYFS